MVSPLRSLVQRGFCVAAALPGRAPLSARFWECSPRTAPSLGRAHMCVFGCLSSITFPRPLGKAEVDTDQSPV